MKKKIGILLVAVSAIAFFVNTKLGNNNRLSKSLAKFAVTNVAEAQPNGCDNDLHDQCEIYGTIIQDCDPSFWFHHCKEGS